jgi:tetratricopeptide (TPR) repeat protein
MHASEHLKSGIKCLEKAKYPFELGIARSGLGYACSHLGDLGTGRKHIEAGIAVKRESWIETGIADQYFQLSHCQFESGDPGSARDSVEKALELSQWHHEKLVEGQCLIWLGKVLHSMQPAENSRAEDSIQRGIKILNELNSKPFLSIGYLFLGQFYAAIDRRDESLKNLHLAKGMFEEMGMDYWLIKTREALRRL